MSVSGKEVPGAGRHFVVTPYREQGGRITPVIPQRGPYWDGVTPCRIGLHYRRPRKTGPPWGWVAVGYCATHGHAFTLYLPGHVPYGRAAWVDLAPDGSELGQDAVEGAPALAGGFTAASDASKGERWPRHSAPCPPDNVRSSQRRRVARAATLLGLVADAPPSAETVAGVTGLPTGRLVEAATRLATSSDLPLWDREVTELLTDLARRSGRALMDRLAVLGHLTGWWGHPYRWAPLRGLLLELGRPFWAAQASGTSGPALPAAAPGGTHDFGPRTPP